MQITKLGSLLLIALTASAQSAGEAAVGGFVTDTWCGRKGANAQHAEHARRTVASGVAQYALYVENPSAGGNDASKRLYILEPQATAAQHADQRVKITGTLRTTPLTRAGQSYAPDAVAAYKDPSTPSGFRASGATADSTTPATSTTSTTSAPASAARSTAPKVQSHEDALDQTTPIAGVLTIVSIEADPAPVTRRSARKKQ